MQETHRQERGEAGQPEAPLSEEELRKTHAYWSAANFYPSARSTFWITRSCGSHCGSTTSSLGSRPLEYDAGPQLSLRSPESRDQGA